MPGTRKDLERSALMMGKIKNPQAGFGIVGEEEKAEKKTTRRSERVYKRAEKSLDKTSNKAQKITAKNEAGKITKDLAVQKINALYDKASKKDNKAKYIAGSKKDAKAASKLYKK